MEPSNIAVLQIAVTVLLNLAFAVLVGILMAGMYLQRLPSTWSSSRDRPLAISWTCVASFAVGGSMAALWLEGASMAEVPVTEAWSSVRAVLQTTHFGRVWLCGALMLAIGRVP